MADQDHGSDASNRTDRNDGANLGDHSQGEDINLERFATYRGKYNSRASESSDTY